MRTLCDACESAAAIVFCAADEAALCRACDEKVRSDNLWVFHVYLVNSLLLFFLFSLLYGICMLFSYVGFFCSCTFSF